MEDTTSANVSCQPHGQLTTIELLTKRGKFITDDVVSLHEIIVDFWIVGLLSLLGIVTNILNLVVFAHQGYQDSINISMSAIASWDLVKCVCSVMMRVSVPLTWFSLVAGISWRAIVEVIPNVILAISGLASYGLASYVSVERCFCVCLPFTVKSTFTPGTTWLMVVAISVCVIGMNSCSFFFLQIIYVYDSKYNATVAQFVYTEFFIDNNQVLRNFTQMSRMLMVFLPFIIITTATAVTMYCLRKMSIQKQSFNQDVRTDEDRIVLTPKEKRVVKMLLIIIGIFIANLTPRIIFYIAQFTAPEFFYQKSYHNTYIVVLRSIFVLDFLNHTSNFFVFLKMSSNFRETFFNIFDCNLNGSVGQMKGSRKSRGNRDISVLEHIFYIPSEK